jgi:GDP-L-fucose synthase
MRKDSKIFIAGHRGVAGQAIVSKLRELGYSNLILKSHLELDLTDQKQTNGFFRAYRPEYVFLCAARIGGIVDKAEHPAEFIMSNLQIETNVISAAHECKVRKLLFMGSAYVYPVDAKQPICEESLFSGEHGKVDEPYIIAKIAGVKLCEYYYEQYHDIFFSVMPCAFFGPGDSFELSKATVVPSMMRRMYEANMRGNEQFLVWGTGKPLREFLYSRDIADACVFLMEVYEKGGEYLNLGNGGVELSIEEIAQIIKKVIRYPGKLVFDPSKPDGTFRKTVDSSKLMRLGWRPKTPFEEGVRKLYDCFLDSKREI